MTQQLELTGVSIQEASSGSQGNVQGIMLSPDAQAALGSKKNVALIFEAISRTPEEKEADPKPMVLAFVIDGTEYFVAEKTPLSISLQYLTKLRKEGWDSAVTWAVEAVIGTENFMALIGWEDLQEEQWHAVCAFVAKRIISTEETVDPKSGDGQSD